jgi:hypothetical protein
MRREGRRHESKGLRLGIRRRLRCHSRVRADLRPRRPDPDVSHDGRSAHPQADAEDARSRPVRKYFQDATDKKGGYFSHIDPITLEPAQPIRWARTGAKKNWNSVGDHAPAYLINLYLATGEKEATPDFLESTRSTPSHVTSRTTMNSPFVQEKFFEDWSEGSAPGAGSRTAPSSGTT